MYKILRARETQALGIGYTHCVTAIHSGERQTAKLLTGSTLINWGPHLSQLVPVDRSTGGLQIWFRGQRHLRFDETAQEFLDVLVNEAFEKWNSWVRKGAQDHDDTKLSPTILVREALRNTRISQR